MIRIAFHGQLQVSQLPLNLLPMTDFMTECHTISGSGLFLGLSVVFHANTAENYCSSTWSQGFHVNIHKPNEYPRQYSLTLPSGYETQLIISSFYLKALPSIRKIAVKHRKCIFQDESRLKHFRYDGFGFPVE